MAITIHQQPRLFSLSRQDLIYVATSDNVSEIGFRYRVEIELTAGSGTTYPTMFISPNDAGACVVNIRQFVSELRQSLDSGLVHSSTGGSVIYAEDTDSLFQVSCGITEFWDVAGVLTENAGSEEFATDIIVAPGYYNPTLGFSPDPESTDRDKAFTLNGNTKRWFSDRKVDTHVWSWGDTFSLPASQTRIFIPVREADYGVLNFSNTSTYLTNQTIDKIRVVLYDSTGTTHTYTEVIGGGGEAVSHGYVYPANLNASAAVGIVKPEDYAGWRYYTVTALTSGDAACSVTYIFYNTDLYGQYDCNNDVVRIAWANSRAGWDYFNFIKRNEESLTLDRKRYRKVLGNYGAASDAIPFTYGSYESGLTERNVISDKYLNITSDWIQEGEFVFLQHLLASSQVHWLHDDGTFTPVVIEDTDYVVKRERNGKLKNLTLKLKLANTFTA